MASKSKSRAARSTTRKRDNGRGRLYNVIRYALIAAIVAVVVGMAVFFLAYKMTKIPSPNAAFEAQTTNVMYSGGKQKIGQFAEQNRESISLSEIPEAMQNAAIAAEDRSFWTNRGIDPKGIIRAAFSNAQGNSTQGASTITQQYVKLLYLNQERTLTRKVKEAFLSLKVQQEKSKSEILQGYLNTVFFGRDSYGVQAAANAYFGIPAKELNVPQSAMLAAVLNSPNYLSPDNESGHDALIARYDYVLNGMVSLGTLDAGDAERFKGHLPQTSQAKTSNKLGGQRGFALSMVKAELKRIGFSDTDIATGGLRVQTTLTPTAMKASEDGVKEIRPEGKKGLHVASASVDVKTGRLLGFYAGQDYLESQLNWAVLGSSPGSTFKPFALAAGIKDGFSLKDTFDGNSPYELPNGDEVGNQGEGGGSSYGSAVSMLTATMKSINTAFVDMTESMDGDGAQKVKDMAIALGIPANTPGLDPFPGISLGSATISPINMANAYATFANDGMAHPWFIVQKVTRASDGKVLYTKQPKTDRALDEDISRDVSYALQQVTSGGTGTKANVLGRPVAGKTGTATNSKDQVSSSWFVGYTPQVATAVMYARGKGNEQLDGGYLDVFYGGTYPAQTWAAIMKQVMDGMDEESFPPPAWVDGTAPSSGHAPTYAPAPKSDNRRPGKKKNKKNNRPEPAPVPVPDPAPAPPPAPPVEPAPPAPPPAAPPAARVAPRPAA